MVKDLKEGDKVKVKMNSSTGDCDGIFVGHWSYLEGEEPSAIINVKCLDKRMRLPESAFRALQPAPPAEDSISDKVVGNVAAGLKEREEEVQIFKDINWDGLVYPYCKHPAGSNHATFHITQEPLFSTIRGYVLTGYLFRAHNKGDKDLVRHCPYFFAEDGSIQSKANAAVFVKLGDFDG